MRNKINDMCLVINIKSLINGFTVKSEPEKAKESVNTVV